MAISAPYTVIYETRKFSSAPEVDYDLLLQDSSEADFDRTTLITISGDQDQDKRIRVRVDWCNHSSTDNEFSVLLIPETGKLFFGARFFWGIIDLATVKVVKLDYAVFWYFDRHPNCVVMISELSAESYTLSGELIHEVRIDPLSESKDFEDRIEFSCIDLGKQTLRLR